MTYFKESVKLFILFLAILLGNILLIVFKYFISLLEAYKSCSLSGNYIF